MLLNKNIVDSWVELRKMDPEEIMKVYPTTEDNKMYQITFESLKKLADFLSVDISNFIKQVQSSDLDNGVKIARENSYHRDSYKDGKKYYTYNHLVTTNEYSSLMPLRVDIHCKKDDPIILNGGHDSTEMVYITKGEVLMTWENKGKHYSEVLYEKDSAYIHPGISHSFSSNTGDQAELIAINW